MPSGPVLYYPRAIEHAEQPKDRRIGRLSHSIFDVSAIFRRQCSEPRCSLLSISSDVAARGALDLRQSSVGSRSCNKITKRCYELFRVHKTAIMHRLNVRYWGGSSQTVI